MSPRKMKFWSTWRLGFEAIAMDRWPMNLRIKTVHPEGTSYECKRFSLRYKKFPGTAYPCEMFGGMKVPIIVTVFKSRDGSFPKSYGL